MGLLNDIFEQYSLTSNDDGTPPDIQHKICGTRLASVATVEEAVHAIFNHRAEANCNG
jgi:hypothetical protein